MRIGAILLVLITLGGCAAPGVQDAPTERRQSDPPQLWSDHKSLDVPVGSCAERAFNVLTALGFSGVVRNGNYSYGNLDESRAAVKCVEMPKGSFVYFAVASPKKEKAEELRNRIAWKF